MNAIHCFWEGHHNNCKSIPHNYNSTSTTNYILSNSSLFCIAIIIILQIYYFFIAIIASISNHDVQLCDFPFQHGNYCHFNKFELDSLFVVVFSLPCFVFSDHVPDLSIAIHIYQLCYA